MAKRKPDLPQGTLDMLVLKALSLGPMHGYGIGRRIRQLAEDMLTVEEGTLYPALYRIEERGWIRSEWGLSDNNSIGGFERFTHFVIYYLLKAGKTIGDGANVTADMHHVLTEKTINSAVI